MEVLYILIPIAIILVAVIIAALIWAVQRNQFDDLERHGHDVLMDDDRPEIDKQNKPKTPS